MTRAFKALLLCLPLVLVACDDDDETAPPANNGNNGGNVPGPASIVAIEDLSLLQFSVNSPGVIQAERIINGHVDDGSPFVIGMDFRPSTGALYVLFSDNRLYTVNTSTGAATEVAQLDVGGSQIRTINFDPTRDRLRVLTAQDESFDFFPDGTLAGQDSHLSYASGDPHASETPTIDAVSFPGGAGAQTTTAYGIDSTIDSLVTIGSVNGTPTSQDSGQVFTVAELSRSVGGAGAPPFDIETVGVSPSGYLTDSDGTETHLFRVNLSTGLLTDLGEVGVDRRIQALSVVPGTAGGGSTNNPPPPPTGVGGDELCTTPINGLGTTVEVGLPNPQCLGCTVQNANHLVDTDLENFARFDYSVAVLLGGIAVQVHAPPGVIYPAGRVAGGTFSFPGVDLLEATVAPDLTITTFLEGEEQETTTLGGDTIILDIAGNVVNSDKFFAGLLTTLPFDTVEIFPSDGVVGALTQLQMFSACAGAVDEGAFP